MAGSGNSVPQAARRFAIKASGGDKAYAVDAGDVQLGAGPDRQLQQTDYTPTIRRCWAIWFLIATKPVTTVAAIKAALNGCGVATRWPATILTVRCRLNLGQKRLS